MERSWMPQKIGCWPQFLWWELDEVLVALIGIAISALSGNWYWCLAGIAFSYLYKIYYKNSDFKYIWKDIFVVLGIVDIPGLPPGISREFCE